VIVYVDTSVLVRAFLPDEDGHDQARELLDDGTVVLVTGTWTRIEVVSALARANANGRAPAAALLDAALATLGDDGRVAVVSVPQDQVEHDAFTLARDHGLRAMDAWHLACAGIALPLLAEADEIQAFATCDAEQAAAARHLGLKVI
jgi:predicted nucleic acid-binding protein